MAEYKSVTKSPIVAPLAGVARPAFGIRKALRTLHGTGASLSLKQAMEDTASIDGLSVVLTRGIEQCTTKDGRLDTRDLAAYLLKIMGNNQQ